MGDEVGLQFDTWYREEYPRVLAALTVVIGNGDVAADATAEAFVRAYERWDRVSRMLSPGGWLYRVALNVARRRARRLSLERELLRPRSRRENGGLRPDQSEQPIAETHATKDPNDSLRVVVGMPTPHPVCGELPDLCRHLDRQVDPTSRIHVSVDLDQPAMRLRRGVGVTHVLSLRLR